MKTPPASLPRSFVRSMGAGLVALVVLFPKTTQAEAVNEYERMGEMEDDGQRFGAIVVKGVLEASPNAPGGWTLVRSYENKSDQLAEVTVEERIDCIENTYGGRVSEVPEIVLQRTQKLRLGANEKKAIGTYLPEKLGQSMTKAHRAEAIAKMQMNAGQYENLVMFKDYTVSYLRPLAKGETAAPPLPRGNMDMMP